MTSAFVPSHKRTGPDDQPEAPQVAQLADQPASKRQATRAGSAASHQGAETKSRPRAKSAPRRSSTPTPEDREEATRGQRRKLPTDILSPGKGCSPEELRMFSVSHVTNLEDEIKRLHAEQISINEKVDKMWPFLPRMQEMMQRFDELNKVIFPINDAKASFQHVAKEIDNVRNEGNAEVHRLRGELSQYAAKIQESTDHIPKLEGQFKTHVVLNFAIVEKECLSLRAGITETLTAQATSSTRPSTSTTSRHV